MTWEEEGEAQGRHRCVFAGTNVRGACELSVRGWMLVCRDYTRVRDQGCGNLEVIWESKQLLSSY